MLVGIFADAHDHADNVRRAVRFFNEARCGLVLFAGDLCSPLVVPPLRKLTCPVAACWGDNDGNKTGVAAGMRIVGPVADPPVGVTAPDGTRFLLAHQLRDLRDHLAEAEDPGGRPGVGGPAVAVFAHTHRHSLAVDRRGRLLVNPGECGGWVSRTPSVAVVDTAPPGGGPPAAKIVPLPQLGPPPTVEPF